MTGKGGISVEIDFERPLQLLSASFRYFAPGEHHVRRICVCEVLLLVFSGILRFSEDGREMELHPGEYYIQRAGSFQDGRIPSDEPKYLYVHFIGSYTDGPSLLPRHGLFDIASLMPSMTELDRLSHSGRPLVEREAAFYRILSLLLPSPKPDGLSGAVGAWLETHFREAVTLDALAEEFHFSKNHILARFKAGYGSTPFQYLRLLRLREARRMLEVTSLPLEQIATEAGFGDYSYFYRCFIEDTGVSPARWRRQHRV